jgi:hypothetical protein
LYLREAKARHDGHASCVAGRGLGREAWASALPTDPGKEYLKLLKGKRIVSSVYNLRHISLAAVRVLLRRKRLLLLCAFAVRGDAGALG